MNINTLNPFQLEKKDVFNLKYSSIQIIYCLQFFLVFSF